MTIIQVTVTIPYPIPMGGPNMLRLQDINEALKIYEIPAGSVILSQEKPLQYTNDGLVVRFTYDDGKDTPCTISIGKADDVKPKDICQYCEEDIPMGTIFVSTGTGIAHERCFYRHERKFHDHRM